MATSDCQSLGILAASLFAASVESLETTERLRRTTKSGHFTADDHVRIDKAEVGRIGGRKIERVSEGVDKRIGHEIGTAIGEIASIDIRHVIGDVGGNDVGPRTDRRRTNGGIEMVGESAFVSI